MSDIKIPTIKKISAARKKLGEGVRRTPVWQWKSENTKRIFGEETELHLKLELFQYGGSFKSRGTLTNMFELSQEQLELGVTAVSAGNHAISVAYSAKQLGTSAKVVMPETANTFKVEQCKSLGAEVVLVEDVHAAFDKVKEIEKAEGRSFIHPFEGPLTALGTATVGLELSEQVNNLDAVIVPVGGGGLIAGIACCMKQIDPEIKIVGVEPEGADSMSRSLTSGQPEEIESVNTFADSLGAPYALPYSFGLTQKFVDKMVKVTDAQMANTMQLLFDEMKLAVEPAGASAVAALRYHLLGELQGKRIGVIVCGTNIDLQTYYQNITEN